MVLSDLAKSGGVHPGGVWCCLVEYIMVWVILCGKGIVR